QAKAPGPASRNLLRGAVPPIHHVIGRLGHLSVSIPQRFGVPVSEQLAEIFGSDERRIADDEIGLGPTGRLRTDDSRYFDARFFVGDHFASDRVRLAGSSIPAGERAAVRAAHEFLTLPGQ